MAVAISISHEARLEEIRQQIRLREENRRFRYLNNAIEQNRLQDVKLFLEIEKLQSASCEQIMKQAASCGSVGVVRLMIQLGATDYNGAMLEAAQEGKIGVVEFLWDMNGVDNDHALAKAIQNYHPDVVSFLLKRGGVDYKNALEIAHNTARWSTYPHEKIAIERIIKLIQPYA